MALFLARLTITVQTALIGIIILIHAPEETITTIILIEVIIAIITRIAVIPVHTVVQAATTAVAQELQAAEEEDTNRTN